MIAGLSHIVLGSRSLEADAATLGFLGWERAFVEKALPAHPDKRRFMATSSPAQTLAFLRRPDHVAVELIHYGDAIPPAPAPFRVVLPGSPPDGATATRPSDPGEDEIAKTLGVTAATWPGLTTSLWFDPRPARPPAVVHLTARPHEAREFWHGGLGLRECDAVAGPVDLCVLRLSSPAARTSMPLIVGTVPARAAAAIVDGPGFRCLSFHTTDIDGDGAALLAHGATASTGAMALVINGRPIRAALLACLDGFFVELIQPCR
jgi:hypothetical protein